MGLFSERYGYTKPSDVIIREQITPEIESAICNCIEYLRQDLMPYNNGYRRLKIQMWIYYLNNKINDYYEGDNIIQDYIEDDDIDWFYKLDLIEFLVEYVVSLIKSNFLPQKILFDFSKRLNKEFERLSFAYRLIDNKIVEITSKEEITTVETVLVESKDNVRMHLSKALELYAFRPEGDYCNSIKESISAVEAYCREKTGENNLGDSLKKLEKVGVVIPNVLRTAFEKLYAYTNQPTTGIRHALMDSSGTYVPKAEEALFMLVSCSAFINYLNKKK